jgi:NADH-quinone oxidoreductase subunit J
VPQVLFYLFAILAIAGASAMVIYRSPVSSALSMVGAFVGLAALFIGLNAYFVGVIQILVYAGAIMVLFIFIVMLLDLKASNDRKWKPATLVAGILLPFLFICQLLAVLLQMNAPEHRDLNISAAAEIHRLDREKIVAANPETATATSPGKIQSNLEANQLPDVHLVGRTLFAGMGEETSHNLPFQVMGVLLLVSTIGVVVLSKRSDHSGR